MKELAQAVVNGFRDQPALLAMVSINVLSLGFFGYVLHEISTAAARDDALLSELVKKCSL